jgi:hypothetical protein
MYEGVYGTKGALNLVRIEGHMDASLYSQVLQLGLPHCSPRLCRYFFYQDGARPHWEPAAVGWFDHHYNVHYYDNIPGNSPAFESVWGWMVNYIQHTALATRVQLDNLIDEAWRAIPKTRSKPTFGIFEV